MNQFLRITNDRWLQLILTVQAILVLLWVLLEPQSTIEFVYGWICLVSIVCFVIRFFVLLAMHKRKTSHESLHVRLRRASFYAAFEMLWLLLMLVLLVCKWLI